MPMFPRKAHSSDELLSLSSALSRILNVYDLSVDRNIVVNAFQPQDVANWEALPPIWHQYDGATICINMGKFYQAIADHFEEGEVFGARLRPYSHERDSRLTTLEKGGKTYIVPSRELRDCLVELLRNYFDADGSADRERRHQAYVGGKINPTPIENNHARLRNSIEASWDFNRPDHTVYMLYNMVAGAVMREAGYAALNQPILFSEWFERATGYQRNIITVFEELRVEAQQITRINKVTSGKNLVNATARKFLRAAVPATANTYQIIGDMTRVISSGDTSGVSVAGLALNASLILGREHVTTLLKFEIEDIADHVDTFVGTDRLEKMRAIWDEYIQITDATEANIMPLIRRWEELFPSDESGENAKSSVAPSAPKKSGGKPEKGQGKGKPQKGKPEKGEGDGEGEDGEGEGEGKGEGEGESEGEGEGQGSGEGEGEEQDGEGQGSGKNPGDGDGDSDGTDEVEQQEAPDEFGETDQDVTSGTKGAHATALGGKNTTERNKDGDPGIVEDIVETPGAYDMITENIEPPQPAFNADYGNSEYGPKDITPSRISFAKAVHREASPAKRGDRSGRTLEPSASDHAAAQALGKVLENLNIYDRGKFKKAQVTPPGRMKSRAAVQQAAERSLKLAPNAKPWDRTVRTVDMNPPLAVGIMSDVSGSMGWAEQLTAKLAWIIQHAVSTINGKAACLAFGEGVTVTLRPGEKLHDAQVVAADSGGEEFDMGAGTMDVMLNLVGGSGTRLLFVITDGYFVFENMMEKAAAWVDLLASKGVYVVWITPNDDAMLAPEERRMSRGLPHTPANTIPVCAEPLRRARYGDEKEQETRNLINRVGAEIQKAVRANKAHH